MPRDPITGEIEPREKSEWTATGKYIDYEYYEYTTTVYINGKVIKRKKRVCTQTRSGTSIHRQRFQHDKSPFQDTNVDKVREMQKGTVYENNTDLNLTDGHLLKGAVNMTLGTQQTVMHFTDGLKNDNIGLSTGDVFQDGGFLRVVTTDSNKTSKYQSAVTTKSGDTGQYYSLSYFVIGDLLLYFGETTEHEEDTSVLIKFAPYTFAFKPICVTGNVMGNKWNKTNIVDLTTTYLRIRSFTAKPSSFYSGKCSFLVIGQKAEKDI